MLAAAKHNGKGAADGIHWPHSGGGSPFVAIAPQKSLRVRMWVRTKISF
jgi:hypothetical protein